MKESILIAITIVLIYIFLFINKTNLKLVETNGNKVLVRDLPDYNSSANLLSALINNMYTLRNYLIKNIEIFPEFSSSINLLRKNFNQNRTRIYENSPYSQYTSYSVNKGEEFVFCLRCRQKGSLHTLNILTYVAVHEMAHAGCHEIGHTKLFNKIFKFYLEQAVHLNLYVYENYSKYPINYCGMKLYTNILN